MNNATMATQLHGEHPMKPRFVRTVPIVALFLIGSSSIALADTSDVKGPAPLIVAKSGEHCKDDPNCFNRIHYAIKPVAHVKPGQHFVLETRDGLDSDLDFNSTRRGRGGRQPEPLPSADRTRLH